MGGANESERESIDDTTLDTISLLVHRSLTSYEELFMICLGVKLSGFPCIRTVIGELTRVFI